MPLNRSRYPLHEQLTFGIEFEFYVHENIVPMSLDNRDAIISTTQHNAVPVDWFSAAAYHVKRVLDEVNLHKRVVLAGHLRTQPIPVTADELEFRAWVVTTDRTLEPTRGNYRPWLGLEVVSPILRNRTTNCNKVQQVGQALLQNQYLRFNPKCGLHVHVGRGGDGIPLRVCQRLFSLLFLYGEKILDILFRSDRKNNLHCENIETQTAVLRFSTYTFSMTGSLPEQWFNACFPDGAPEVSQARVEALRKIWTARDINEFCDMTSVSFRLAINFTGLKIRETSNGGEKRTVEFRKAEGDLAQEGNIVFLRYWPQVCIGLLAFAFQNNLAEFARVMREARAALNAPIEDAEKLRRFLNIMELDETLVDRLCERAAYLSQYPDPDPPGAVIVEPPLDI